MSLRAELVRLGLRWFVKRKIGPATTLEALRRQDAFLARLVPPPPKGTQATHVDLDGVKAVAVVTPASLSGRLVLYLHGGGHVSGSPAIPCSETRRPIRCCEARRARGSRAIISPAPILVRRMRRRFTPTRPDCRRRSSKSAATRSCSTIPYAWRSGCAPPDVRSSSKYGRGCRTPGRSGRGSFRKRARPSSASARSCRARCSHKGRPP